MFDKLIMSIVRLGSHIPSKMPLIRQTSMKSKLLLHFASHLNTVLASSKDIIHLFKSQIRSLRIQKEDNRYENDVGSHKDEISFPLEAVDEDGRDHDLVLR